MARAKEVTRGDELHEYIIEAERSQSNILWEDAHRNARGVDQILWKGSETARPIQRAGIAVFAFMLSFIGLALLLQAIELHTRFEWVLCALLFLLSARLFRNATRGLRKKR